MMIILFRIIIFLLPLLASACPLKVEVLPIRDVLADQKILDSFVKGIPSQIGTPAQPVVLMPYANIGKTWIYGDDGLCGSWEPRTECRVYRGGLFHNGQSESFRPKRGLWKSPNFKNVSALGFDATDRLKLGDTDFVKTSISIPKYEWNEQHTGVHGLGLGPDSQYLKALVEAGRIASRVWSMFWGRELVRGGINGSLLIGGYDAEKAKGRGYTMPLNFSREGGCTTGMRVTLSNVEINFRNGSHRSMIPPRKTLTTCLVPHGRILWDNVPEIIWQDFWETMQHSKRLPRMDWNGIHGRTSIFWSSQAFDGDITFVLQSGLRIRVPNDQYLVHQKVVRTSGIRHINTSLKELLVQNVTNANATGKLSELGRFFLTAAYLMVDHENSTFTLWEANPSIKSTVDSLSNDALAGIAVGASAGVFGFILVLLWVRRQRLGQHTQETIFRPSELDGTDTQINAPAKVKPAMMPVSGTITTQPSELPEENQIYELDAHEDERGATSQGLNDERPRQDPQ
ncbi:hypothetical protein CSOJ01_06780 [Colletotrichum sojae]|uniref:Peptidase A1 domain-containing protein n=1 Tax=Colletotrichum sojae TaxID=2175907 RepID=A0A8H6JB16_9PEZI|nr:hypothetical protein CSOJ01_06780 [Colletotrichum sojae]